MELQLKNIGMIKEANVKIDGLTVIAGENDTGKSTLGKALYLILESSKFKATSNFNPSDEWKKDAFVVHTFQLMKLIFKMELEEDAYISLEAKDKSYFFSKKKHIGELSDSEKNIIFIETPLVWNFSKFFRDIALVESQMNIELEYPFFLKNLNFKLFIKNASKGIDIRDKMISLMGGQFEQDDRGDFFFNKNGKRIELENTSTGIKQFGIFQVLSQNNYLNENTVLILDEPEVHLHPKWQLEMAKIIVELVEKGVKIVVNSHSPYMLEALEVYSLKQKINSNFYLAEKKDEYSMITDVTNDLEPIYFKLAEQIQRLEEESLENFKW